MKKALRAAVAALLAPVIWLVVGAALTPLPAELRASERDDSVTFTARNGEILREVRAHDSTRARWISLEEAGPHVPAAMLAAEDARFHQHLGVDPVAVVRASGQAIWHRRVVSGASTLTMQLARVLRPHPKSAFGKLTEMAMALRIEASLGKAEILEQYLNRAPFGPQIRGVEAASLYAFDKPASQLSLAEAATLAAIPRGPALYDVRKHPDLVKKRRDRVLGRMLEAGTITRQELEIATSEPLVAASFTGSFGAPHLVQSLAGHARGPVVKTTIDAGLQRVAEEALRAQLAPLVDQHVQDGAVVVVDNASGDVLAYVGSADFADADGQNDGARQKRQPGSTLKPFVYAYAFERGALDAASVLEDTERALPVENGTWAPHNYDERFHGPVRAREALASSLNVPAVLALELVGERAMLDRLRQLGFASLTEEAAYYGPGLALGDGEVTLLELARAYSTLARGGVDLPLRTTADAPTSPGTRIIPEPIAHLIADILSDDHARASSFGERSVLSFPFPVAAKTGTSKGYRDNWTAGFTRDITVAVWAGNFDGSPMRGISGITGAAPIFHAVMSAAMQGRSPAPLGVEPTDGLVRARVCALSGTRVDVSHEGCDAIALEWLPVDRPPERDARAMHELVSIDPRNGLRAGPGCPVARPRVFERFEGSLLPWARAARRDLAPEIFSPLCPGEAPPTKPLISYPPDGARFVLDPALPRSTQVLAIRVAAPPDATLEVDHALFPIRDAQVRWPLSPGAHTLLVRSSSGASSPVRVRVD